MDAPKAKSSSLLGRKRDMAYFAFFLIHIPVMFCVDLAPLYPDVLRPTFMTTLREWYITTYADRFFTSPPAWFGLFTWMEALYHVPLSFWAVGALWRNDPKLPVQLLVYGVQTAITTAVCIADYLSWSDFSNAQKIELGKLYVPYLALSVFMAVDMVGRLNAKVSGRMAVQGGKKTA